jgi:hypothetical protein
MYITYLHTTFQILQQKSQRKEIIIIKKSRIGSSNNPKNEKTLPFFTFSIKGLIPFSLSVK